MTPSSAPTVPSPAGAVSPCRDITGCTRHAQPGSARCAHHSEPRIPVVRLPREFRSDAIEVPPQNLR